MTMTRPGRSNLLTLTLGGVLVTCLLVWHNCTTPPPAGPRAAPTRAIASPPHAVERAPRIAATQPRGVDAGPRKPAMQRTLAEPVAPLTRAYATARAEALLRWRGELEERIAPCVTHQGPPSLRTVEFSFGFDAADSSEASQRFEVAVVDPGPEVDGEMAQCLRDCVGMAIDVIAEEDQPPTGHDDFSEWVTLALP